MKLNNKLKKMFESLADNDDKTARALFHEAIVEMAKDIYSEMEIDEEDGPEDEFEFEFDDDSFLLDTDFDSEEDDLDMEMDFEMEEGMDDDLESDMEEIDAEMGDDLGDAEGDLAMGMADEEDMDMGDDDLEGRISDIEDAFEELKMEFEKIADMDSDEDEDDAEDMSFSDMEDADTELEESVKMKPASVKKQAPVKSKSIALDKPMVKTDSGKPTKIGDKGQQGKSAMTKAEKLKQHTNTVKSSKSVLKKA